MSTTEKRRPNTKKFASIKSSGYGKIKQVQNAQIAVDTSQFFQPSNTFALNPLPASTENHDSHGDDDTLSRGSTRQKYEIDGTIGSEAGDLSQSATSTRRGDCIDLRENDYSVTECKDYSQKVLLDLDTEVLQTAQLIPEMSGKDNLPLQLEEKITTIQVREFP
eukprot:jgi/Botrbrau1/12450/Bobra.0094s0013.2